ncbi:MAG TPA: BtpA/SgcQ family protein [Candidatus Limnocylindrales bacterium]|nr:BtpA/SgcQ family protein [Candidatus Limnocylindrales bacterium]
MPTFPGVDKPLVAMIHLPALPGAANYDGRPVPDVARQAAVEARQLADAGFDGVMLQNTHDRPARLRVRAGTIAAMGAIAASVRAATSIELGINVHKNDAEAALAIAVSSQASFVRVKVLVGAVVGVEGVIEGVAESALDIRREYASDIEIWADLYELTSWSLTGTNIENLADLATRFGLADRLIVTDPAVDESVTAVARVRSATAVPILVGGRTSVETIGAALNAADGVIVGSCLRQSGRTDRPLDPVAIEAFMRAAGRAP